MTENKKLKPSSSHLRGTLKTKIEIDKDGKPVIVEEKIKIGIKAKLKAIYEILIS